MILFWREMISFLNAFLLLLMDALMKPQTIRH
jgi:hypothetical protein